jgi:N-acetyl-gamma-glutamyl-phosphate reductase
LGASSVPSVIVAGASGYTGALAARILDRHPDFDLVAVTSRSDAGRRLDDLYPYHRVPMTLEELDLDRHGDADAAIVAYPHGAAARVVAGLRERSVKVVDLSADFRLRDVGEYERWYVEHPHPELIEDAVYGLPERYREAVRDAALVANPGCYPTATVLALAPLAGHIADVVVDAKSGVSGAGRKLQESTQFVTADENVTPYGVGRHRHMPEIDQELHAAGAPRHLRVTFTPHLLPLDQGELVSCYVTLSDPLGHPVTEVFERAYAHEPFVEIVDKVPGVRDVRDTNMCRISARLDERTGKVFVFAAIDNLWKGSSSQAVQNLNLMFGLDETAGIAA